jgi:hypothetical protein
MKCILYSTVACLLMNCVYPSRQSTEQLCSTEDRIVISERVGDVVDAEERAYFKLFPKIYIRPTYYKFESATYYSLGGGGYEVRVTSDKGILVARNYGSEAVTILRDYIDEYERIVNSRDEFEKKWQIVDYDELGQPITKGEIDSERKKGRVTKACGLGGCVLVGSVGCILSAIRLGGLYSIEDAEEETAEIQKIMLYTAGGGILVGATGALIGRGLESTFARDAVKAARKPQLLE